MKRSVLLSIALLWSIGAQAQTLPWTKLYSDVIDGWRALNSNALVLEMSGGDLVLVGHRGLIPINASKSSVYIARTDVHGEKRYEIVLPTSYALRPIGIVERGTGYRIAAEAKASATGTPQLRVITLDADGVVLTDTLLGPTDVATTTSPTQDGGMIVATHSPYLVGPHYLRLIRLDSNGTIAWTRQYNDSLMYCNALQETSDGGFIVAGYVGSGTFLNADMLLLRVDSQGEPLWRRTYGDSSTPEAATDIRQTDDGGYLVVGTEQHPGQSPSLKPLTIRTDENGILLTSHVHEKWQPYEEVVMTRTRDGNYMMATGGYFTSFLMKINTRIT
jgi:hypothetical protein